MRTRILAALVAVLTLAALASSPVAAQRSAPASTSHIERQNNARVTGDVIARHAGITYQQCEERCLADNRCVALEHFRGGGKGGRSVLCRLFRATRDTRESPLADIGWKRGGGGIAQSAKKAKKKAETPQLTHKQETARRTSEADALAKAEADRKEAEVLEARQRLAAEEKREEDARRRRQAEEAAAAREKTQAAETAERQRRAAEDAAARERQAAEEAQRQRQAAERARQEAEALARRKSDDDAARATPAPAPKVDDPSDLPGMGRRMESRPAVPSQPDSAARDVPRRADPTPPGSGMTTMSRPAPPPPAMAEAARPPAAANGAPSPRVGSAAPEAAPAQPSAPSTTPPPAPPRARSLSVPSSPPAGGSAPPAVAAGTADWDVVPVFYGTDRARKDLPKRIAYGTDRARRLELGRALVTVPKIHQVPAIERPWAVKLFDLTLYQEAEDPKRHFTINELKALSKDEAVALIRARLDASRTYKGQALVFVHGYNNAFDDALYRTAQIAYDLQFDGASFLYSWPSASGTFSYPYDRESAQQAEQYLGTFIQMVLSETGAASVSIIAHSMGNQPLLQVLRDIKRTSPDAPKIDQIILAAPDVDRDTFEFLSSQIRGVGRGITMYASSNDIALVVSRRFAGGVPRAGDVPSDLGPAIFTGIDTIDISALSTDYLALNHSTYAEKTALLDDIRIVLKSGTRPPESRLPILLRVKGEKGDFWRYPN